MVIAGGRSLARLFHIKAQCLRTSISTPCIERVPALYSTVSSLTTASDPLGPSISTPFQARYLATKPVGRPKAHTGTATGRKPRAKKDPSTAAKKPASKSKTTKPKAKPKSKAKAKPKPKPKKPKRKVLTEKAKARKVSKERNDKIKELRKIALTPPKPGQVTAWLVFSAEQTKHANGLVASQIKEASGKYKELSPEERERYNHTANQNKAKYEREYRDFITSHTPSAILAANTARKQLARLLSKGKRPQKFTALKDERQVRGPLRNFTYFFTERQKTNDYVGMDIKTRARLIGREWKELTAAEKKPYDDRAAADYDRYRSEIKTVYDKDLNPKA